MTVWIVWEGSHEEIAVVCATEAWRSAKSLYQAVKNKAAADYRSAHRAEIEAASRNASGCTIIMSLTPEQLENIPKVAKLFGYKESTGG